MVITYTSVNNIYDFDVNGLKSTKASLLRITDKDNYVNANVKFDFIETDVTNFLEIYNNASQEIKVKARYKVVDIYIG